MASHYIPACNIIFPCILACNVILPPGMCLISYYMTLFYMPMGICFDFVFVPTSAFCPLFLQIALQIHYYIQGQRQMTGMCSSPGQGGGGIACLRW